MLITFIYQPPNTFAYSLPSQQKKKKKLKENLVFAIYFRYKQIKT